MKSGVHPWIGCGVKAEWPTGRGVIGVPALHDAAGDQRGDRRLAEVDLPTFSLLAPGVVQDHATLGFPADLGKGGEITGALMLDPRNSVAGLSLFNRVLGLGPAAVSRRLFSSAPSGQHRRGSFERTQAKPVDLRVIPRSTFIAQA